MTFRMKTSIIKDSRKHPRGSLFHIVVGKIYQVETFVMLFDSTPSSPVNVAWRVLVIKDRTKECVAFLKICNGIF